MSAEANLNEIDEKAIGHTIATLRRMRTSAESSWRRELYKSFFRSRFNEEPSPNHEEYISTDETLCEADSLSQVAATSLVNRLFDGRALDSADGWQNALANLSDKYKGFTMTTANDSTKSGIPHTGPLSNALRALRLNDNASVTNVILWYADLGRFPVEDLFTNRVGILAPLSSDILIAKCISEFVRQQRTPNFPVAKPVILASDYSCVATPKTPFGKPIFWRKEKVVLFVDTVTSGDTSNAMRQIAQREYPRKEIYP